MCGIAGFLGLPGALGENALRDLAQGAAARLALRGPDDEGIWLDAEAGVALVFRRLAIIDLSQEGHQPMTSACGRYVMVYNGEIYNYLELRADLESAGARFRGHSDSEVLLAGIARWGLVPTLTRANGMFAIALWDRQERQLSLARDRMGQKPLYYGRLGQSLVFASELKALRHHPDFDGGLDRGALALFLRHGYVPAPYCIHPGLQKLPPGHWVTLEAGSDPSESAAAPKPYWSAAEAAQAGLADPLPDNEGEALEQLDALLRDAVKLCLVSDVPLGAFLSGGIDSSMVVALMQAQSERPVRTFSIGFREAGFDEAAHAAQVAEHLGTDHSALTVTPREAQAVIPSLPQIYDEPFADVSQIPTYLVSRLARERVTVSLSGDGGDELFGGYTRYLLARGLNRTRQRWPSSLRRLAAGAIELLPVETWDRLFGLAGPLLPERHRVGQAGHKLHKLARVLSAESEAALYQRLVSLWQEPSQLLPGVAEPPTLAARPQDWPALGGFSEQLFLLDSLSYLPDDILVKLDRASMAVSLEGRVPYLDHRVVEFSWRLPLGLKLRDGQGKWLLRRLLGRYLPERLFERPKMGFGVPIGAWLRGDLRDWAESLLDQSELEQAGVLEAGAVRRAWDQHLAGRHNWQYQLWAVLMFEAWRRDLAAA